MKLQFKDTSNSTTKAKIKPMGQNPHSSSHYLSDNSQFNNYKKRPLKSNSQNLSFEGLSFGRVETKFDMETVNKAVETYGKLFGSTPKKHLETIIEKLKGSFDDIAINDKEVVFREKTLARTAIDSVIAPIKDIPIDVSYYFVTLLNKIGFEKTSIGKTVNNISTFVKRKEFLEHETQVKAFKEILENCKDGNKTELFLSSHGRLDPLKANYSSDAERALTRAVTGMATAGFLANDAYNLSRVLNDDPKQAAKDKKQRLRQEIGRVGLTSYLTLVTLGALAKYINKSAWAAVVAVVGSAAASEFLGRIFVGTPVLPVSEEQAKKLADKKNKSETSLKQEDIKNSYNPLETSIYFKNNLDKTKISKTFAAFTSNEDRAEDKTTTSDENKKTVKQPKKHTTLTLKNVLRIVAGVTVAGFAIKYTQKNPYIKSFIDSQKEAFTKYAKKSPFFNWFKKETKYTSKEMDEILDKLKNKGFNELAETYEKLLPELKDGAYSFGKSDKKWVAAIKEMVTYPFKFLYKSVFLFPANALENTYKLFADSDKRKATAFIRKEIVKTDIITKKDDTSADLAKKLKEKFGNKIDENSIKNIIKDELKTKDKNLKKILKGSLGLIKKTDEKDLEKVISKEIFNAMDTNGKSNYSNADLAVNCKFWSSLVTSFFLVADHYNLVMINSRGKNKDEATQKAKERGLQRLVSVFYSNLLLKTSNGLTRNLYNASLPNTVLINATTQSSMEVLTRKSIGIPILESSKQETIDMEVKNEQAKGLKGKYFRLMAFLIGKKPLSERQKVKSEK